MIDKLRAHLWAARFTLGLLRLPRSDREAAVRAEADALARRIDDAHRAIMVDQAQALLAAVRVQADDDAACAMAVDRAYLRSMAEARRFEVEMHRVHAVATMPTADAHALAARLRETR